MLTSNAHWVLIIYMHCRSSSCSNWFNPTISTMSLPSTLQRRKLRLKEVKKKNWPNWDSSPGLPDTNCCSPQPFTIHSAQWPGPRPINDPMWYQALLPSYGRCCHSLRSQETLPETTPLPWGSDLREEVPWASYLFSKRKRQHVPWWKECGFWNKMDPGLHADICIQ